MERARQRRCAHPSSKMDPRRAAKSLRSVEQSGNRFARMQLSCNLQLFFGPLRCHGKSPKSPMLIHFENHSTTKLKSCNLGSTFVNPLVKTGSCEKKKALQKGGFWTNASKFQKSQQKLMNLSGMGGQMNTTHTESQCHQFRH